MKLLKSAGGALGFLGLAYAVTHWPRARTTQTAEITWTVRVPAETPADASIYLCGSLAQLGSWSPQGLLMRRVQAQVYTARAALPLSGKLEYKFTRGTWSTAEAEPNGADRANRKLEIIQSEQVLASVEAWSDQAVAQP